MSLYLKCCVFLQQILKYLLYFDMYVCVECGEKSKKLYSTFPGTGILKIEHCRKCHNVVDKYIELDATLLFLDVVLLRASALRHILCNKDTVVIQWKLAILCMFCDGYRKWIEKNSDPTYEKEETVFHAATQLRLYLLTLISGVEMTLCVGITLTFCFVANKVAKQPTLYPIHVRSFLYRQIIPINFSLRKITQALLLGNCGRLLFLPAIVWAQTDKNFHYIMAHVVYSSTLALSIVTNFSYTFSLLICITSLASVSYLQPFLHDVAETWFQF